jgi:hypothetical protein
MLSTYVRARVVGLGMVQRLGSRIDVRSEAGQVSAEYIGLIVVVGVVMIALSRLADPIANTFESLIIKNLKELFG